MFETLKGLLGLRIDDPTIISFIETNGYRYPKKPFISNRSTDTTYWLENKKLGMDLLFDARYYLIQGDKKGIFVPVLQKVLWHNNKSKTVFPQAVDFNDTFEGLQTKLGIPTMKSSDISPIWLNDDGSESFYRWRIDLGDTIEWGPQFNDDNEVRDISLGLKYRSVLFYLYDEWIYEDYEKFLKMDDFDTKAYLLFIQWATGQEPLAWVKALNRGYVTETDFPDEHAFIHAYINNLSGHDILYTRDVERTGTSFEAVKELLDKRLEEYKAHKFSKSKQL